MSSSSQRGRRWLIATGGLAAAIAVTVGILGATGTFDPSPRDLNGRLVHYELDASPRPEASATPDGSGEFIADSVGLDVPLGSLNVTGGDITPPGFTSAYLVRDVGVTPDRAGLGAVYVVMHSLRDGAVGPGNALIDVDQKKARIADGARISVAGVDYTVTGSRIVTKTDLSDSDIWTAGRNELIVITCLQKPEGGPSTENVVIIAQRTGR